MYNRYVPQPDGTYCRQFVPDPPKPPSPQPPKECPREQEPAPEPCRVCPQAPGPKRPPSNPRPRREHPPQSAGSFLRQLLPRDFDTEDLLIILLLLLMAGDSREDQNFALLTLALYLFL